MFRDLLDSSTNHCKALCQHSPTKLRDNARELLNLCREQLATKFTQDHPIEQLLQQYSYFIDQLLLALWSKLVMTKSEPAELSLLATGGYGRNELLPGSDIDLLVLYQGALSPTTENALGDFFALLWDIKLIPSQHILNLADNLQEDCQHLSTLTTLLEARLLSGDPLHLVQLNQKLQHSPKWPLAAFLEAKLTEQAERHQHYATSDYSLQPDLKNSPGGLRDIHLLQWLALKQTGSSQLIGLVSQGILTVAEVQQLQKCQQLLWRLRYALHLVSHKKGNRLLFEYQSDVAQLLKFTGEPHQQVEQMMRGYFNNVKRLIIIREIALLAWQQSLVTQPNSIQPIDSDLQLVNDAIDLRNPDYFIQYPAGLVKVFYVMAQLGLPFKATLPTLRRLDQAIQHYQGYLIEQAAARDYFLKLLGYPKAVQQVVIAMHHYDLFKIYTPAWYPICGLMQFNFFHSYPVDEHSLQTVLHLERLAESSSALNCALFAKIYASLPEPHLLFIAALLHDIGKGRGGEHAVIGANIAALFAQQHQLNSAQVELIRWLVEQHLLFSHTAQRLDIQDPTVIQHFMQQVANTERLNYLFCLTVADICATDPSLWNDWRNSVLSELYRTTLQRFQHRHQPNNSTQCQQQVLALVNFEQTQHQQLLNIWRDVPQDYFLRHPIAQLAWHTPALLATVAEPQILIMHNTQRGATELFIYTKDKPSLFAIICDCLHRKNLSIVSAQIFTSAQRMALDTFLVLQPNGQAVTDNRHSEIRDSLLQALQQTTYHFPKQPKVTPSAYFNIKTKAKFTPVMRQQRTQLSLTTYDRTGLLALLAQLFASLNINLHDARIATDGKQVNDFFLLSHQNRALSQEQQHNILQWIQHELL